MSGGFGGGISGGGYLDIGGGGGFGGGSTFPTNPSNPGGGPR